MKHLFQISLLFFFSFQTALSAEEIIKRKHYTLSYNEDHEVANWVSYELDHSKIQNCVKRTNSFKADPLVSTGSAVASDYKGSGFDRGHLVPAGDMKFSKEAMSDTFYFSNMSPQPPRFNQVIWARLENLMRSWALIYKKIWIVTGPVLKDNLPVMGNVNRISIPESYFKVVLRKTANGFEGIGFIMQTNASNNDLRLYTTTIKEIEELSNTDFFKFLNESEEEVENNFDSKKWDFTGKFEYLPCQTSVVQ
jgi:endonuclease G